MRILFIFLLTISIALAQPQGDPIVLGESFSLKSKILNETRPYLVYLPDDYSEQGPPVSVMYLLDGGEHFHHTTGIVSYMTDRNLIPKMMVVAIPNTTDRTRDLTPPIEQDNRLLLDLPTAGGANKMLTFLKKELIPHIEKKYHTNPYRMLVGHSFGGLFAVHTLLNEPDLFDSYIAISPSLWWDDQLLPTKVKALFKNNPKLEGYYYMTLGNESPDMLEGVTKFEKELTKHAPESFGWKYKLMEAETHGTIPHRSTYDGLEAIFKDSYVADLSKVFAENGIEGVEKHYARLSEMFGYEMKAGEVQLNALGYRLMQKGEHDLAQKVFAKNIENYPQSYNTYDSMGEFYMNQDDKRKAITFYMKSMELHPGNPSGAAMLKRMGAEYNMREKIISLTKVQKEELVGTYSFGEFTLRIQIKNDELIAIGGGWPQQALLAFPNNRYLLERANMPMWPVYDKNEKVIGFELQTGIGEYLTMMKR